MTAVRKTLSEINQRIRNGDAVVVTADKMPEIVEERGAVKAAEDVDVVTTGTFGAMCSSGVWMNFGHSDPPIKMRNVFLNDVMAYSGGAAVDAFLGATQVSETDEEYGGGHVIEDLVRGREVSLKADSHGTDCYPRTRVEINIGLPDLNQAVMLNPRNSYQRYNAATNSRDETIYTYMGALLPQMRNVTFSGSGVLNPLCNDPQYRTIGLGTRIFLGGGPGYVIGSGTQHSPQSGFGTLMVKGDLKQMSQDYLRGACFQHYGTTLYIGVGVPIPVLDEGIARSTAVRDRDIPVSVIDYGVPRRDRPKVADTDYAELRSGHVKIDGNEVPVSPLSSFKIAKQISATLAGWVESGEFLLSEPVETLPADTTFRPMKAETSVPSVEEVAAGKFVTCPPETSIQDAARTLTEEGVDTLLVRDEDGRLQGIITSWDIAKAISTGAKEAQDIMTRKVLVAHMGEPIDGAARKLEKHGISALPIVDRDRKILGIVSEEDIARFVGRRRW